MLSWIVVRAEVGRRQEAANHGPTASLLASGVRPLGEVDDDSAAVATCSNQAVTGAQETPWKYRQDVLSNFSI